MSASGSFVVEAVVAGKAEREAASVLAIAAVAASKTESVLPSKLLLAGMVSETAVVVLAMD